MAGMIGMAQTLGVYHYGYWGGPLLGVQKANVFTAPKMRLLQ